MLKIEKILIVLLVLIVALILIITKKSYGQRYQDGSWGLQASIYPYYNFTEAYRDNKFKAFNLGFARYGYNYTRSTGELFYSEKKVITDFYKTDIKEYIASYGYGFPVIAVWQNFFNVFVDFGALVGFTEVKNYDEVNANIKSPFKQGVTFGAYGQLNAEMTLFDFLTLFARAQLSYNGFVVYERWPFYQGFGVRIVFN
ncbi:MAG: hypothetical protein ACQPRJ_02345 [Solitalea-like symbiont of Acarus siro]